jgi:V/A-type H+-transporting ATPase subunit D
MAELKLTKTELKTQQNRLNQLSKYLPTLQLKKALLQAEVFHAESKLSKLQQMSKKRREQIEAYGLLFTSPLVEEIRSAIQQVTCDIAQENIAGAEIPKVERIEFKLAPYDLFSTPAWFEQVANDLIYMKELAIELDVAKKRLRILRQELREVSIRVNLFEKVLIPRCKENIKRIKIFLGDIQLSAVCQAKVAKQKIEERKELHHEFAI